LRISGGKLSIGYSSFLIERGLALLIAI
jgi:hypothetical protein